MNQRLIVTDTDLDHDYTIDNVEASVWSELDAILRERGIVVDNKTVFQGNSKEPFKSESDPVMQQPVLYIYLFPLETESGDGNC